MQRSGLIRGANQLLQPLRPRPRLLLTGHESVVVCVVVCTQLDLIVSASATGAVLVHSLETGRYVTILLEYRRCVEEGKAASGHEQATSE